MSKKLSKRIPVMGYVGDGKITKKFIKYFAQDSPVAQTIEKLSKDYYAGRISLEKAEKGLIRLGEGQKRWIKEVLTGLAKPQLYFLGLRWATPSPGYRPSSIMLRKQGKFILECAVCYRLDDLPPITAKDLI